MQQLAEEDAAVLLPDGPARRPTPDLQSAKLGRVAWGTFVVGASTGTGGLANSCFVCLCRSSVGICLVQYQYFIKSVSNLNQSCIHFQSTWLKQFNSKIIACHFHAF
jgi:hypothetical protein